jgi:hypothetical protein
MKRRWSVALVIVMLAALAPSAALAAPPEKPVDAITGILWEAGGGDSGYECSNWITVDYTVAKGPPRYVSIQMKLVGSDYIPNQTLTPIKVERDGSMAVYLGLAGSFDGLPAYVSVRLTDRAGEAIRDEERTVGEYTYPETCAELGADLGTFGTYAP